MVHRNVTDASGGLVRHAILTATQIETRLTRETTTGDDGGYTLALLPVGHYRVKARADGFQTYVREGVQLNVNETVTLDFPLPIGSEPELLEVRADAISVETSNDLGHTMQSQ